MGTVKLLHTGRNRNGSNVTESAAKNCMSTIAYKPILANFTDINGELDFTTHDFEINDDGDITYYEKQVGCFTADKPYLEQDSDHEDRKYIFAKCAIPRQYTAAADIIERKNGTKLSAELGINSMSYDSREKELLLEDIVVLGATCLGVDPESGKEIGEGMEGARLDIADFSAENNSSFTKSQLIEEITQAVMNKLDNHIAELSATENQRKEESGSMDFENNKQNEENTEQDNVTEVMEATTEETPEVVDNEEVTENFDGEDGSESSEESEETGADDESGEDDSDDEDTDEDVTEEDGEENDEDTDANSDVSSGKKVYSINGMTFEVSLSEIQFSLNELINNTYSESDNDYYSVEVYEGSKTVVMCGWFSGKAYKQGYKVRNGVYSLIGDRVSVKAVFVTADEEAELDKMRANYSSIADKLAKYESEPEKMSILNSNDYLSISDQKDFEELKKQENHFDLSVDELKTKADAILLQYAKSGKLNFSAKETEKKDEPKKDFFAFARVEQNTSFLDGLLKRK